MTDETRSGPSSLGILCLDERPYEMPERGSMYDPACYPWPILRRTVPGASVAAVTSAEPALAQTYVEAANALEAEGAGLMISNCGFSIAYDAEIRRNVSVPVATSSLLFLSFLGGMLRKDEKIGILTFDANKLSTHHLSLAWPAMPVGSIRLGGLEGTASWRKVVEEGLYDWDQLEADSLAVLERLLAEGNRTAFVLIECCSLCSFMPKYRAMSGRPVFDIVSLANLMIEGMVGRYASDK